MFTRDQISRTRQEFWIAFGKYMAPVPSAEGAKVSWMNYHTGVKDIYFRMETDIKSAVIAISMESSDIKLQQVYFEKLKQMKAMLEEAVGEEWTWELHANINGKTISRIYKELPGVSVMNREQWSDLISFFKPRLMGLDVFWGEARWGLEG